MGDAKVELGDGVTVSHGSELMVRQEDLEGAMNSMKQHAPIWNGVKADYPAWLWEAVPFLDSMGLNKEVQATSAERGTAHQHAQAWHAAGK